MKTFASLAIIAGYIGAIVATGYGYIHNIYTLATHVGPFAALEIVRVVGIVVAPVGVVMGYVG